MYILSLLTNLIVHKPSGKIFSVRKSCDLSMTKYTFLIFISRRDVDFMVMVDDKIFKIGITLHDQDCDLSSQLADGEVIFHTAELYLSLYFIVL